MVKIESGNIFDSEAQTIVNTINCMGFMGRGIALECKIRYPDMFLRYNELCRLKKMNIGKLWLYKAPDRWILNFPTKYDWRKPSREEYLEAGLEKFIKTYKEKNITSIAYPLLGASNGGLAPSISLEIMKRYLNNCDIPVTIYLNSLTNNR